MDSTHGTRIKFVNQVKPAEVRPISKQKPAPQVGKGKPRRAEPEQAIEAMHAASLALLARVGARVESPAARELLLTAGCTLGPQGRVLMPAGAVERAVAAGREILRECITMGGSITAEHGIGVEKLALMDRLFAPADLEAMRRVRGAFDPTGRLNPGKLIPEKLQTSD